MQNMQHRSYRKVIRNGLPFRIEFLLLSAISIGSIYFYVTVLYNQFMVFFNNLLLSANINEALIGLKIYGYTLFLPSLSFIFNDTVSLVLASAFLIVFGFALIKQKKIALNIVFWIVFLVLWSVVFIVYFIVNAENFPYDFQKYFHLYLHAYIGFMFMSFIVMSLILALTPDMTLKKIAVLIGVIGYYFLYSFVRLAMALLLVSQVSVVFAPLLYFTIFYDFIVVIYFYTNVLYRSAQKFDKRYA